MFLKHCPNFYLNIEAIFEFGNAYVQDDVVILLSILESTKVKIDVWTYATSYKLKTAKEWWGVSELRLACPPNPKETVMNVTTNPKYHCLCWF